MATLIDLVVVGAGGHGREVRQCVADINADHPRWNLLGFVDDRSAELEALGMPMLGTAEWLKNRNCHVVVAIGASAVRLRVVRALEQLGVKQFATLLHPTAQVGRAVVVGEGSMVCAGSVLTTDIVLGSHVIVNVGAVVSHDARLADFVTVSPRGCLCGGVRLGEGVELGASATVLPGICVGAWSVVGAGAMVNRDVSEGVVTVGVPARTLRLNDRAWQDKT